MIFTQFGGVLEEREIAHSSTLARRQLVHGTREWGRMHLAQLSSSSPCLAGLSSLHENGSRPKSMAADLESSRQTMHATLKRWVEEQFAGRQDKSHAPHHPARKTTLKAVYEVKKLAENPALGAYRVTPRQMMLDTGGQSKWAKKAAAWKKVNSFSSHMRQFLPLGFLLKVTAQIRPTSCGAVSPGSVPLWNRWGAS